MTPQSKSSVIESLAGPSFLSGMPSPEELLEFRQSLRTTLALNFHDYWISKCSPDDIPLRRQMQPNEMKPMLTGMLIWDYLPEIEANRVRLAGTALREALPIDPSGRLNTEVLPPDWNAAIKSTGATFYSEKRPLYFLLSLAPFARDHVQMEFVSYPLRGAGLEANMGIGVVGRVEQRVAA